ncbi:MAG: hypothetical protein ACHQ06_04415 [Candidatus Dormibacteria bacterium]
MAVRGGDHRWSATARLRITFWLVYIAVGVGFFVVSDNPTLVPGVAASAQHAADAMHRILAGAAATPPVAPTAPVLPPQQARVSAPGPGATSAPSSIEPPIGLVLPTAATVPATRAPARWSSADCAWASATLTRDAQLDLDEAAAVQSGGDSRYGSSAALVGYYRDYAAEWLAVNRLVAAICHDHAAPTYAQISQAEGWFTQAEQAHAGDNLTHPENAEWNNGWIGNYQRMVALFAGLPH